MNLLSNALKFTFEGSISVKVSLETRTVKDNSKLRFLKFKVKDTGVGIAKSDTKNLFKMFSTVGNFKQHLNSKGTGLGLVISKKLAEVLGGTIRVDSEEGTGTEFTFDICEKMMDTSPILSLTNSRRKLTRSASTHSEGTF